MVQPICRERHSGDHDFSVMEYFANATYSLDLIPWDYNLFLLLQYCLAYFYFQSPEKIEETVKNLYNSVKASTIFLKIIGGYFKNEYEIRILFFFHKERIRFENTKNQFIQLENRIQFLGIHATLL